METLEDAPEGAYPTSLPQRKKKLERAFAFKGPGAGAKDAKPTKPPPPRPIAALGVMF